MIRYAMAVVVLTFVYALTLSRFEVWDLAAGVFISSALLFTANRRFGGGLSPSGGARRGVERDLLRVRIGRVVAFFPFVLAVLHDTLSGGWRVILLTLGVRPARSPGMVSIPLAERSPEGVAVSAFVAAFSPGTLLVRVDEVEGVMWIHAIDAEDPEEIRELHREFYERYQRKVFP